MTDTIAIGFYSHASTVPTPSDLMRAYEALEQMIRDLGMEPSWFSADDSTGRGQWKKIGGAAHKKFLQSGGESYENVGLCVAPVEGKVPGYDRAIEANFLFSPVSGDVMVKVAIQEPALVLGRSVEVVIAELASLWRWDYGFGLQRDSNRMPLTYLGAGISRTETAEERRRIEKWYATYQPEVRRVRVRDIFPYNIIGDGHLKQTLRDDRSLRMFIEADPDSSLQPLANDLWLWTVTSSRTEAVRERLLDSGVVVSE